MLLIAASATAQRVSASFRATSLSEALVALEKKAKGARINFIYNELEDFSVTTTFSRLPLDQALRQVVGFYPIRIRHRGNDYSLECVQKDEAKVRGHIVDEHGRPLEFATVTLLSASDSSYVNGGVSNAGGDFVIPCSAPRVIAKVTFVGYRTQYRPVVGGHAGTIGMHPDAIRLKAVQVKGKIEAYAATSRGYMAKVQGTPLADMGTADELITHLPMVLQNGEVAGHGTPEIYINSKKVRDAGELKRLQATDVLQAEVITVPGAQYDASVRSVIRIKTVRRSGEGWSGTLYATYRQGHKARGSEYIGLNYRTRSGIDLFGYASMSQSNSFIDAEAYDHLDATSQWDFRKRTTWKNHSNNAFAQLGLNWQFADNHSLGITYESTGNMPGGYSATTSDGETWRDLVSLGTMTNRTRTTYKPSANHSVNAYYSGTMGRWGIDFNADYYRSNDKSAMAGSTNGSAQVASSTESHGDLWAEKLVAKAPVGSGTLTFGEEMTSVDRKSDFTQSGFSADNHIRQRSSGYAVFADYSLTLGKWGLDMGLRYQHEHNRYYAGGVLDKELSPDYSMLLPSLTLNYAVGKWSHRLYLGTYRGNPPYSLLSSTVNYRSQYEYDTGNPFLKPSTSYQVGYSLTWNWLTVEPQLLFVRNSITSFQQAYDDAAHPGVIIMDYRNIPITRSYGVTVNARPKVGFWQMNYTLGLSMENADLLQMGMPYNFKGIVVSVNLDNTLNLPHNWMLNISGAWQPYYESGSAKAKGSGGVNLRLSKSMLRQKALRIAIIGNDIFHTQKKQMTAWGGIGVRTQFSEYRDARTFGIDLSYSFNATRSRYKGRHAGQGERQRL